MYENRKPKWPKATETGRKLYKDENIVIIDIKEDTHVVTLS